jgi:hypothetical protein
VLSLSSVSREVEWLTWESTASPWQSRISSPNSQKIGRTNGPSAPGPLPLPLLRASFLGGTVT